MDHLQIVILLVLGPGAAYETRAGLVGSTLMGRSQLKVSTGTCSGPVQVAGSGCSNGGRRTNPGSRDVTNSKCSRHFKDTVKGKDRESYFKTVALNLWVTTPMGHRTLSRGSLRPPEKRDTYLHYHS